MGWLIALAILTLIALLPLGVSAQFASDGAWVKLCIGPFRYALYPAQKKKPKEKKNPKEKPKAQGGDASGQPQPKSGGKLSDFYPLIDTALAFLDALRRKIRVNRLDLVLTLAGDDPCDLAQNYGKAWAALGNLWPRLEEFFVIRKRNVQVQCDFTADTTRIYAHIHVTLTVARLLGLLGRYGVRALKQYLNIKKGGATV